jgi:hypothetical protein
MENMDEKWSEKYKKSIDCNNPKGFSQRAHCQGKKKKETKEQVNTKFSPPPHETQTYNKIMNSGKKQESKEQTMADASGSFEGSLVDKPIKRKINKIPNMTENKVEATEQLSGGFDYDVPLFAKTPKGGRKNPMSIDGEKSIKSSRAVTDKNFPKWGGPDSVFIKIKEKCKKFPYCNQGDINAIEPLKEAIEHSSKKYGLSVSEIEKIILKEIREIFI